MIIPRPIRKGDKLRIVSPAGKISEEHLLPAVRWLKGEGFEVELGKHALSAHFQFAGTDQQRLGDLQEAMDDQGAAAVLCSRGGYGTARLLDLIRYDGFIQHPKWLVGFSDITTLHTCLNNLRVASIHGAMPRYFFDRSNRPSKSLDSLMTLLKGGGAGYIWPSLEWNRRGTVTAELMGGNLSVLTSLMGTPYEPDTDGKILFLEDIDEYLYHADRMLRQLKSGGKLEKLAGMVLGNFTGMKDNESPFGRSIHEIVAEVVEEYNYPVCYGFPAGHDELNLALAFGLQWELIIAEKESSLQLKQSLAV